MRRLLIACVLLCLTGMTPAWAQAGKSEAAKSQPGKSGAGKPEPAPQLVCDMPPDLIVPSAPLTRVAAALATRGSLNILALGSGSTVGESSGNSGPTLSLPTPKSSFPHRMILALNAMRPAQWFNLTVRGGRNMTADMMLPVLRHELAAHQYDLVLWQTGTVEAVRGIRPDTLRSVLQDGADAAEAARADLVLIDPQFSRFLRANADLNPYETVLTQMTTMQSVTLFRRFDLTQNWVNNGQVDLERVERDERDKTIEMLNECLGQALARYVLAGADAR